MFNKAKIITITNTSHTPTNIKITHIKKKIIPYIYILFFNDILVIQKSFLIILSYSFCSPQILLNMNKFYFIVIK